MENKNWLSHLSNEMMIGARNNNLCSYLIALEGWRRGLTLKFYSRKVKKVGLHVPGCLFSLSSGEVTHTFYKSRGMRVKGKAFTIGDNKFLTKKWLSENGVQVPEGEKFTKGVTDEEIINYANQIGFPVVLKPAKAAQGKGVIANIENEDFLRKSLIHVRSHLGYQDVILEQFITGKEYRVYVMKDEVIAVLNRVPANVTGDGVNSIKKLIELKNKERRKNPRLYSCLIKIDFEIENQLSKVGYKLDSVPKEGEQVFLREKSNITSGGDSVDVTDEFPVEVKKMAIEALKSIPDFPHGGVDLILDSEQPTNKSAYVIELTPVPQIGSLVFPMKGRGRDVPSAILDYYFPETKDKRNSNPNVYFDLKHILTPLMSKSASEITVLPVPDNLELSKKYNIKGEVQGIGLRRWIRKKALEADLFGYVQNLNDGSVDIVVAGKKETVNNFRDVCKKGSNRASITSITEAVWNKPIKVGFEIKDNPKIKRKKAPQKNLRKNRKLTLNIRKTLKRIRKKS
ncbi:acylphosphatase [Virgibacillus halodenitrificans]|uniref:acylphosphatase n=1 Tax=Virgibacillus halodenitrificans TaxID=1482 RepID=UPI002DBCB229|nr:acylphosphatase [Virgibacillus halodenitrificans]MEC2158527.1 acylphosphatase [Virgibacillus halodenitrificans]